MITDVENIILNKEYFELTAEELESVNELVQNAEEYDEMKWFLASTQDVLVTDKIEATPELKEKVLAHLHSEQTNRKFWLNGLVVFLWPTDKEVYRRPAFQMSLAALLLIGFLMVTNKDLQPEDGGMAINDVISSDDIEEISSNEDKVTNNQDTVNAFIPDLKDGETPLEEMTEIDELMKAEEKEVDKGPQPDQPLDDAIFADESDMELEPNVTDADGFYTTDFEIAEVEEERVDNSVSNANNNENNLGGGEGNNNSSNTSGYKSWNEYQNQEEEDDRNKDKKEGKPEKKKDKFKTREESRKNKLQKSDDYRDESIAEDYDMTYGNMYEPSMDSTTVALSNNRVNTGSDVSTQGTTEKVNDPGTVSTITTESTVDKPNGGGLNLDGNSDIIPNQMSVAETTELRKLFKTYK